MHFSIKQTITSSLIIFVSISLSACLFDNDPSIYVESFVNEKINICNSSLDYVDKNIYASRNDSLEKKLISYEQLNSYQLDQSFGVAQVDVIYRDFSISHSDYENNEALLDSATKGIVASKLKFAPPQNGGYDMYDGVEIVQSTIVPGVNDFDSWFKDKKDVNKRVNKTIDLTWQDSMFIFSQNIFSPLDFIDSQGNWLDDGFCDPNIQINGLCESFGPQTLSINCHSKSLTNPENKACNLWNSLKNDYSEKDLSNILKKQSPLKPYLRNADFTMMAYLMIEYNPTIAKPLHFTCSGDCWIYVDGVLAADVGGYHKPISGKINFQELAKQNFGCKSDDPLSTHSNCTKGTNEWQSGTWHHIHIFHVNRQSWNSSFSLGWQVKTRTLNEIKILKAEQIVSNQDTSLYLLLKEPLSQTEINSIASSFSAEYAKKADLVTPFTFGIKRDDKIYYYKSNRIKEINRDRDGVLYRLEGGIFYSSKYKVGEITYHENGSSGPDESITNDEVMKVDSLLKGEYDNGIYAVSYWRYSFDKLLEENDEIGVLTHFEDIDWIPITARQCFD